MCRKRKSRKLLALLVVYGLALFVSSLPVKAQTYSCGAGHTDNGDGTCSIILDDPTSDGVSRFYVTYFYSEVGDEMFIGSNSMLGSDMRGVMEWDISGVSDSITVTELKLIYHGSGDGLNDSSIVPITVNQPSLVSTEPQEQALYLEITGATPYVNPFNPTVGAQQEVSLGATAISDFQSQLSEDWFALGLEKEGVDWDVYDSIYQEDFANPDPAPTLEILYDAVTAYQIANLEVGLDAEDVSENNIEVGTSDGLVSSNTVALKSSAGYLLSEVEADFTEDLDWTGVTGAIDLPGKKSVVANLTSAAGTASTHTLYVPKGAADDSVGICPSATTLAQVGADCTGLVVKQETDSDVSIVTEGGQTYWKVDGLSGTGGFSALYIDLFPEDQDDDPEEDDQDELDETGKGAIGILVFGVVFMVLGLVIIESYQNYKKPTE